MSQVFIAYKKIDYSCASVVREKLDALAVPLFIDQQLVTGNYLTEINEQLRKAAAVLVLWTEASTNPDPKNFVISEAQRGFSRDILVAATFNKSVLEHLPVPFNTYHTSDLSNWIETGASAKHLQWQQVLYALGNKIHRPLVELALAIEDGSDAAKLDFLRKYPQDPFSERFATHLVDVERKAFERGMRDAKNRIARRAREAEKVLKVRQVQFEQQLSELRAGRNFDRPNLKEHLIDDIDGLRKQVDNYELSHQALQARAAEAERSVRELTLQGNRRIDDLQRDLADATTSVTAQFQTELQEFERQISEKDAAISSRADEISALQQAATRMHESMAEQDRRLQELGAENSKLLQNASHNQSRMPLSKRFVIVTAAILGVLVGPILVEITGFGPIVSESLVQLGLKQNTNDTEVSRRELDLQKKQAEIAAKQIEIKAEADKIAARIAEIGKQSANMRLQTEQLARSEQALRIRESDISSKTAGLVSLKAELDAKSKALNLQNEKLARDRNDIEVRSEQLRKLEDQLKRQEPVLRGLENPVTTNGPSPAVQIAECDALAAFYTDLDRPANNGWIESLAQIVPKLPNSLSVCRQALQVVGQDGRTTRRLYLQLGRLLSAQGIQQAKDGMLNDAKNSFKDALEYWTKAAALGSGQAFNVLGTYYMGEFAVPQNNFVPEERNPHRAWENFLKSAQLGNPAGLTRVAFSMLLPEWTDNIASRNDRDGRKYLEGALRTGYSRSFFVLGLATREGRGLLKPDLSEGSRLISLAACKNDASALHYFNTTKKATRVPCDQVCPNHSAKGCPLVVDANPVALRNTTGSTR